MPTFLRSSLSILLAALITALPLFAFQSPLSDESIREAYFLGQRHYAGVADYGGFGSVSLAVYSRPFLNSSARR